MSIHETKGNMLEASADALVNTVNTVGVAGKGVALQFRQAFPDNFRAYERAARRGEIKPGRMFVWPTNRADQPYYIINFPTKRHWRGRSRIEDIRTGLDDLVRVILDRRITSVAVPPLGCGNGGLNWADVRPLIVEALSPLETEVLLYPPFGAPDAESMPVGTDKPRMTLGRAALLVLLRQYGEADWFRLSALEVQKLAYFLQESGESLRLQHVKARYGPYAENLNHVLRMMEGHYTRGFGDRSAEPRIRVLEGAYEEAVAYLEHHPETAGRLRRVAKLVSGWETPYALELLATTHWALTRPQPALPDRAALYEFVATWTPRKARLFKAKQIDRAAKHLVDRGYLAPDRVTSY
jgi:O-acetyl-ADP-ribose deacetylase (regulator of RNase III)